MIESFAQRAPGVYFAPTAAPRMLLGEPMDACAFVGVAPRGPARVPVVDGVWTLARPLLDPARPRWHATAVAVGSMAEYHRVFGGFEGPGRLPYAVRAFFAQGGRQAWVVRAVHRYGGADDDLGSAEGTVDGLQVEGGGVLGFRARNEGTWGNRLRFQLACQSDPVPVFSFYLDGLRIPSAERLPAGSLLRLTRPGGVQSLHFVLSARLDPEGTQPWPEDRLLLSAPAPADVQRVERLPATATIDDGQGRTEVLGGLGLHPLHPRWLARVLAAESTLLLPLPSWHNRSLTPADPATPRLVSGPFTGGLDRYPDLVPEDILGELPSNLLALAAEIDELEATRVRGLLAVARVPEIALAVAPDLYAPEPLPPTDDVSDPASLAGAEFGRCVHPARPEATDPPPPGLDGLHLDPASPADLLEIIALQQAAVELAEHGRRFVMLLDVPPGLRPAAALAWRRHFRSAFGAGYFGWITQAVPEDGRSGLIRINPAAVAAGIIAAKEVRNGLPYGPANELVVDGVAVDERVDTATHGQLHGLGINVFLLDPEGVRLTGARTLSTDPAWRQLSVRRLMSMLARALERQMQWVVFEPNNGSTRAELSRLLRGLLRRLFRTGALAGATEAEAFFVQCDELINDRRAVDAGRLLALVGVAPVEPLEFLVVRLERSPTGDLLVEG